MAKRAYATDAFRDGNDWNNSSGPKNRAGVERNARDRIGNFESYWEF
jgi:hypothetical protein